MPQCIKNNIVGASTLTGVTGVDPQADDDIRQFLPGDVLSPPIRQSNLSTLFTCMRMYLLRERCGLEPTGYRRAADIGTMVHLVLSVLWRGESPQKARAALDAFAEQSKEDALAWFEEKSNPASCEGIICQIANDCELAWCMAMIHWEKYPLDTNLFKVHATEKELQWQVEGVAQMCQCRIDSVLRCTDGITGRDGLIIVDHKTSSEPEAYRFSAGFGTQPRLYRLGLSQEEPTLPIFGFCHNVIMRPSITKKQWQTPEEFLEECRDYYAGRDDVVGFKNEDGTPTLFKSGPRKGMPKPRWEHADKADQWVKSPPMQSFLTRFTEPVLPKEFLNMLQLGSRAARCAPTLSNFPPTGEASGVCRGHYGKPCQYLPLCSSNPLNYDDIVTRGFQVRQEKPSDSSDLLLEENQ